MNFVGRILIVMTLVMSILFASLSVVVFATHTNWRSRAADLEKKVNALNLARQQLEQDMNATQEQIAREQAARKFEVAILHTQVDQARQQLQQSETLLAQEQGAHSTLEESNRVAVNELARLTTEVSDLRQGVRDNRRARDESHTQLVSKIDEFNALQGQKANLEERTMALSEQVARFKKVADAAGISEFDNVENVPPAVDGVVVSVGRNDLLEISIGSDDGLKEGHTLDVFRQGTYLGRVVVRKASPDRSVVQIMPEYRKGLIRKGDRVATRIVS